MNIKSLTNEVRNRYFFDNYRADEALIMAPFGQEHFDEGVTLLKKSEAISQLAEKNEILVFVITDTVRENCPKWIRIIRIDRIPDWPVGGGYQNRFIKWAIPFLFENVKRSVYVDSSLAFTSQVRKLRNVFDLTRQHKFFVTEHITRSGWMAEYSALRRFPQHKLNHEKLERQKVLFQELEIPMESTVFESGFIGRVHDSKYNVLNWSVLEQLSTYTGRRDQLALVYAVFKNKVVPFSLPEGEILYAGFVKSINPDTLCFVVSRKLSKLRTFYKGTF